MRKTKELISLHACAGWSASLLSQSTEDRFSRTEAQIESNIHSSVPINEFIKLAEKKARQALYFIAFSQFV